MSGLIMTPVSWGELLDKISILEIKQDRMADHRKLENVVKELTLLKAVRDDAMPPAPPNRLAEAYAALKKINEALWVIEDDIRDCERAGDFGQRFIDLARSVYIQNDKRAATKRELNELLGSQLVEEKSYQPY